MSKPLCYKCVLCVKNFSMYLQDTVEMLKRHALNTLLVGLALIVFSAIAQNGKENNASQQQDNSYYSSHIGLAAYPPPQYRNGTPLPERFCLGIQNPNLSPGTKVTLLDSYDKTVTHAQVIKRSSDDCYESSDSPKFTYYDLSFTNRDTAPGILFFGIVGGLNHIRVGKDSITAQNPEGKTMTFRDCPSQEGAHLTVWSGKPLKSTRLWHAYHYLGYDVENPGCTDQEIVE